MRHWKPRLCLFSLVGIAGVNGVLRVYVVPGASAAELGILDDLVQSRSNLRVQHLKI